MNLLSPKQNDKLDANITKIKMSDEVQPTSQPQNPPLPAEVLQAMPVPPAQSQTPASQPAPQASQQNQTSSPTVQSEAQHTCKCPTINPADWDKKKLIFTKSFYKTFSPRLFHIPISYSIDIDRATRAAMKKGYKPVEKPMILDIDGLFMGSVLVEIENANKLDKDVISFENTEIYAKVSTKPYKDVGQDITELITEIGKQPRELYIWYVSCPKCAATRNEKSVLIAVP